MRVRRGVCGVLVVVVVVVVGAAGGGYGNDKGTDNDDDNTDKSRGPEGIIPSGPRLTRWQSGQ